MRMDPTSEPAWISLDEGVPAREAALVLAARSIPFRMVKGSGALEVPEPFYFLAKAELAAYIEENRSWPGMAVDGEWRMEAGIVWQFLLVTALLAWLMGDPLGLGLVERGAADGGAILKGEWYRSVTALTLHADPAHLLGNMLFGFVCFLPLYGRLGSGLPWLLLLLAGAAGNLCAAWLSSGVNSAVGASTAVMAEAGIMASLDMHDALRSGRWGRVPRGLAAGAAVFSMIGLGDRPGVDYLGHVAGFLCGLPVGAAAVAAAARFPRLRRSWWPGAIAAASVATAWFMALAPWR